MDKFSSLRGVKGVLLDKNCQEGVEGNHLVLCIKGYKVLIERGKDILSYTEDIKRSSAELRNMVKAREISKGNFDLLVEMPQTRDEVQELAMSFLTMKEELRKWYNRLKGEKEILSTLFEALPVGIVFFPKEGERLENKAYEELSKKSSVGEVSLDLDIGRVIIYKEDHRPVS